MAYEESIKSQITYHYTFHVYVYFRFVVSVCIKAMFGHLPTY